MRELKDKTGTILSVDKIDGENTFSEILEGTPYLIRKFRLLSAQKFIEKKGHIFSSIEELRKDLANCDKDSIELPPKERWSAQISTGAKYIPDRNKFENEVLNIMWYQEGGDPFEKLNEIISDLEFKKVCRNEEWEA